MKKYMAILLLIFTMSGCVKIDNNNNIKEIANYIISTDTKLYNRTSKGYKYYIPQGVNLIYDNDFNQKFIVSDTVMYLYTDVISYYYHKNNNYPLECAECYYYLYLINKDNNGYIKIIKEDNRYYLEIIYNYAKIETYTTKNNLGIIISYALSMLSSINYNEIAIDNLINNNYFSSIEQDYNLIKPDNKNINILELLEEYNKYEEDYTYELPDEKDINNLNNE